jgi:hypothetical protein
MLTALEALLDLLRRDRLSANVPLAPWAELVQLATCHRVSPLVYHRLVQRGARDALPASVGRPLAAAYHGNTARNLRIYRELAEVINGAEGRAIPVVVLKGAALAAPIYGNVALRVIGDLDLLVAERQLPAFTAMLVDLGYCPQHVGHIGAFEPHHLAPYVRAGATTVIEPHWRISQPGQPASIPVAEVLARAVPLPLPGCRALGLAPEDLLLHLCVHATYQHQFLGVGLRALGDLAELLAPGRFDFEWDAVAERAWRWGCRRGVYMALRLAAELVGAPVPEASLAALLPAGAPRAVLSLARHQLLEHTDPAIGAEIPISLARLAARPSLSRGLAIIGGRIFVSRDALAHQYGKDPASPTIYGYYVRRLWDLLYFYAPTALRMLQGDAFLRRQADHRQRLWRWLSAPED